MTSPGIERWTLDHQTQTKRRAGQERHCGLCGVWGARRAARGRGRRVLHCGRGRAREQQQRGRAHMCAVEHAGESAGGKGGGARTDHSDDGTLTTL